MATLAETDRLRWLKFGRDVGEIRHTFDSVLFRLKFRQATDVIEFGAEVDAPGRKNQSPLHEAASNGHRDIAALLVTAREKIDARDVSGATPLHEAAQTGVEDLVDFLIRAGAEVNATDDYGGTPLHRAAQFNENTDTIALLLDRGAEIGARSHVGTTPLMEVVSNSNPEVIALLPDRGAEVNSKQCSDTTPLIFPLHWAAARSEYPEVIALLLDRGAEMDATNIFEDTALHKAVQNDNRNVFDFLVCRGANPHMENADGETPLNLLERRSQWPLEIQVHFLRRHRRRARAILARFHSATLRI